MRKRDDSLRALGLTTVSVDKALRADIQSLAASRGMTAAEYLRIKVAEDKEKHPQGLMPTMPGNNINAISTKLDKLMGSPIMQALMSEDAMSGDQTHEMYAAIAKAIVNAVNAMRKDTRQGEFKLA